MRPVIAQFLKNPDIGHWGFEVSYLGEDEHGVWMAAPAGTHRWKGSETRRPTRSDAVFCAPRDGWWHLHYNGPTTDYSHFVDIVTPPHWVSEDRYEMIDLDLDVVVLQDGTIEIQDEDEFRVNQEVYGYDQHMVSRAMEEAEWVHEALTRHREPFFEVAAAWLAGV